MAKQKKIPRFGESPEVYEFAKRNLANDYLRYMMARLCSMFKWTGLPDTIPQRELELMLMFGGVIIAAKYDGNLYVFNGGLGGPPDVYYRPTIATIANPALKYSASLKIGEECQIVLNDSMAAGLFPLCGRYALMMAENDTSLRIADINSRIVTLISAADDRTRAAAEKYLEKVKEGEMGILADNSFLDSLKALPYSTAGASGMITNLIELQQYLKASFFNEIGLNSNYNMKREAINSEEAQKDKEALRPLADDMLKCRQEGAERINKAYGTDITVEYDSAWAESEREEGDVDGTGEPGETEPNVAPVGNPDT